VTGYLERAGVARALKAAAAAERAPASGTDQEGRAAPDVKKASRPAANDYPATWRIG
jgi:hypothetical protein